MKLVFFVVPALYISTLANDQTLNVYAPKLDLADSYFSTENAKEANTINLNDRLITDVSYYLVSPSNDFARGNISFRGVDSRATGYIEDLIPVFKSTQQSIGSYNLYTTDELVSNGGIRPSSLGVSSPGSDIEIISRKPIQNIEGEISQTFSNNDSLSTLSLGGKNGKAYYKTALSYYDRDSYKLSDDFATTSIQPTKDRINSDKQYKSAMAKVGYQISDNDEIAFKIATSEASYGVPPINNYDFYRLQNQNTDSFYLYFDRKNINNEINLRSYYDKYYDKVLTFTDSTYLALNASYDDPPTQYSTERKGVLARINFFDDINKITFIYNYEQIKNELQKEIFNPSIPSWIYENISTGIVFSNQIGLLNINNAITYKSYRPLSVDYGNYDYRYDKTGSSADRIDYQLSCAYSKKNYEYFSSFAQTSKIPSMFEMYAFSYYQEPNPYLKPEIYNKFELGIKKINDGLLNQISFYYYDLKDKIYAIKRPSPDKYLKYINLDKSKMQGFEFKHINTKLKNNEIQFGYSYSDTNYKDNPLDLIPEHKASLSDKIAFDSRLSSIVEMTYQSSMFYDLGTKKVPDFFLMNLSSTYKFEKNISTTASIKNLFDKNYFYNYGDPAMGRSYYLTLNWKF